MKTAIIAMFCMVVFLACRTANPGDASKGGDDFNFTAAVRSLRERGITNISESDLRRDLGLWITNMFVIHAALPGRISEWPQPPLAETRAMAGVEQFVKKHGWNMDNGENFIVFAVRKEPISGIPWPPIASLTYPAVTKDGILYVVLRGFGAESGGVAWNPNKNRFHRMISSFSPLGKGWYSWTQ